MAKLQFGLQFLHAILFCFQRGGTTTPFCDFANGMAGGISFRF